MSHELDPKAGRWYRRLDDEQLFKVVSIDEDDGLVEIKTVEGEVEELDSTEWVELDLEAAEAPEDYVDPDERRGRRRATRKKKSRGGSRDGKTTMTMTTTIGTTTTTIRRRRRRLGPLTPRRQSAERCARRSRSSSSSKSRASAAPGRLTPKSCCSRITRCTRATANPENRHCARSRAARLDDALRHDLDDELLGDAARRAQLRETELDGIVEQHGADRIRHGALLHRLPRIHARGSGHLPVERFVRGVSRRRRDDLQHDELIARRVARQAAAAKPQLAIGLRALRQLEVDAAAERRHAHGLAERRFPRRHGQIEPDVAPLGAKPAVRQQPNLEEQVARPARRRRPAGPAPRRGSAGRRRRRPESARSVAASPAACGRARRAARRCSDKRRSVPRNASSSVTSTCPAVSNPRLRNDPRPRPNPPNSCSKKSL